MAKLVNGHEHLPYEGNSYEEEEMIKRSRQLLEYNRKRRSIRMFSDKPVPKEVIENILLTASTAPSGANKQPWTFAVIASSEVKAKIREAAEKEEFKNYHGRMSERWMDDLKKFGTNHIKEFITTAPWIIVAFKKTFDVNEEGQKENNYYVNESIGLACGFLINAIHHAGLVTLTHTPSPMNFLQKVLNRPENEKAFLLLPVGYAADEAHVPKIDKKGLEEISEWY